MNIVVESRELIKSLGAEGAPVYIMFSGGKDSLTVALLAKEAGVTPELLFMESGIDLPGSIEKAMHYAGELGLALHRTNPVRDYQGDFIWWLRRVGYFPTIQHNWCSGRLKIRPCRVYLRRLHGMNEIYKLTGVRRQESGRRRLIYKMSDPIMEDPEHRHAFLVHPILQWTDSDVLTFLQGYGAGDSNPLYKQVGVSGCYWCPFYQDSILERIERAYPGIFREIIDIETELGKPACSGHKYLRHLVERVQAQQEFDLIEE